jgi:predicted NBD/HSP70 family sugar kinase
MHIRYTAARGDRAALQVYEELAAQLAEVVAWVIGLLRPTHISLVGPIVDLGDELIQRVIAKTEAFLPRALIEPVKFSLAESLNLSAAGAITQALHSELGIL